MIVHADLECTNIIPAFRPIWFGMVLLDPASFWQQLSTTSKHQSVFHQKGDEIESLKYEQLALRSVNDRLSDRVKGISDGIIRTIICFLTHDVDVSSYLIGQLSNLSL